MNQKILGCGKINVIIKKADNTYLHLECNKIEVYGTKLAFSDKHQDLIKDENEIIEVLLNQIVRIQAK